MLLLGIDLETGGSFEAPLEENFITEIGAVLWDTNHGPVKIFSEILDLGETICDDAAEYTGITNEVIKEYGIHPRSHIQVFRTKIRELMYMIRKCDYVVAHNGLIFDKPLLHNFFDQYQFSHYDEDKIWIDTMIDVPYPKNCTARSLTYLAGFHLILNCFPHRAVTDVLTMLSVLTKYDLDEVTTCARSPIVEAVWSAPFPSKHKYKGDAQGFLKAMSAFTKNKDLAKKNKFRWNPEKKAWILKTRQQLLPEIDLPYVIKGLEDAENKEEK